MITDQQILEAAENIRKRQEKEKQNRETLYRVIHGIAPSTELTKKQKDDLRWDNWGAKYTPKKGWQWAQISM